MWAYPLPDGLGSVRQETGPTGNVLATRSFDPFGVPLEGNGGTPFGFTGEMWDADTALLFLRARYYDPQVGRFLSRDPFPGLMTRPGTQHAYAYALNNPVRYTDPSGHYVFEEGPNDTVSFGTNIRSRYIRTHPLYNEHNITGAEIVVAGTAPIWVPAATLAAVWEAGELVGIARWGIKGITKLLIGVQSASNVARQTSNALSQLPQNARIVDASEDLSVVGCGGDGRVWLGTYGADGMIINGQRFPMIDAVGKPGLRLLRNLTNQYGGKALMDASTTTSLSRKMSF